MAHQRSSLSASIYMGCSPLALPSHIAAKEVRKLTEQGCGGVAIITFSIHAICILCQISLLDSEAGKREAGSN
jgi:hypothetical protein